MNVITAEEYLFLHTIFQPTTLNEIALSLVFWVVIVFSLAELLKWLLPHFGVRVAKS